jgi:hypothetical protein
MAQLEHSRRWIALACGLVLWCGCQKPPTLSDEELIHQLVGTWVTDESGGNYRFYGENSFHRDGMHSADAVMHADGATTKWTFSGMWDVRGGKLLASGEVFRSDSAAVETYQVEEKIESLTSDELVLVSANGTRLVRHRKR